jgi:hypothetical protein
MVWYRGKFWRFDGWAIRPRPDIASRKMQRVRGYPGYVQLTDETTGETQNIRSDKVLILP